MSKPLQHLPLALVLTLAGIVVMRPGNAADEAALSKDLTSVIALHGMPCGQVAGAERRGENDYIATCRDGNRYRVFLNPEGRVVVQKL